jgi:excinuclease ABC subunit A
MSNRSITLRGARQNNLKNLDLDLPLNELVVVTGVSGSGKSSLAFDILYAEGQRRYVETFSPYARQFLERMDKPHADRIDGIPPAIAIDQVNPVRTSRSTVGTMTELNDHLKLLYARAATLFCRKCGRPVRRDTPDSVYETVVREVDPALMPTITVTFRVRVPENFTRAEIEQVLNQQGYTRIIARGERELDVIQDRIRLGSDNRQRMVEAFEAAFHAGHGRLDVHGLDSNGEAVLRLRFSTALHCAECDIHYGDPVPNLFSFNSPVGACPTCRGFGRVIGIDDGLVVPDASKTLAEGAIRPFQSEGYRECQDDLLRFARKRGVPLDVPWKRLGAAHRRWVMEGEGSWDEGVWYGVRRFFEWLEGRVYKMHIRVLLSRYRSYTPCPACHGARLRPEALLWRIDGRNIYELTLLSLERCRDFFDTLELPAPLDQAMQVLLEEIRTRLRYLVEVGLGYLTLDRQSRTLSGGEVQRINLTTALGTSLVNTLFVLDEPSVGLHARDIDRLIGILRRLRDAGNSLIVVEHDPQVIMSADRVLELGPGPGRAGGEIVYLGTPEGLSRDAAALTGRYLRGELRVAQEAARPPDARTPRLKILGAAENNLKGIDVEIPLERLVCITGVSGSGKSTLVQDVLYRALRKLKGLPTDPPGIHRGVTGHRHIDEVVLIDQSPIGRTTRSNPASYTGAFDAIRKLFAAQPLSRERGYTAGTFSFNSGTGRCPACGGNGFEHIEMQFLSDVYLRCPDCDGKRYRPEVLEVRLLVSGASRAPSIADVLEMTVAEAADFFSGHSEIIAALQPLQSVGLDYLQLGQPVPTLSGGEAQRLKLAGHLAKAGGVAKPARGKPHRTLFLLDEPTTGLHLDDVARLMRALRQLIDRGHSLIVIEHHLEVIRHADWIIDLGPEGGDAGGWVMCAGTPDDVMRTSGSHTGAALRRGDIGVKEIGGREWVPGRDVSLTPSSSILVRHAREHNLKNIDVAIPRDELTVVTGVSGSGKSTLAFDIVFAEGQRRYLESLNAYARQFVQPAARPDVDAILGIPPTVAIEQRTSRGGYKSTVATLTEAYHFLRLLFVKLGVQYCPDCNIPIESQTLESIVARVGRDLRGRRIRVFAPLVMARKGYYTELAGWAAGQGFDTLRVDGRMLPTKPWPRLDRFREHDIDLPLGEAPVDPAREGETTALLRRGLEYGNDIVYVESGRGHAVERHIFSTRRACGNCGRSFPPLDPRLFSYNSHHGWCESCQGTGLRIAPDEEDAPSERSVGDAGVCPACNGRRLRPEALAVRFRGRSIADYTALSIAQADRILGRLRLSGREEAIARDLLSEIRSRLGFLIRVGLSYLALDRAAPTLSGGEAQRIRLAAQLGSNLQGVCYILDEPTIGLHPRDNRLLLDLLVKLKERHNTLLVVEHDEDTIKRAGHVIDLGPGAGRHGGQVVAAGTLGDLERNPRSVTGRMLREPLRHSLRPRREPADETIEILGASLNNLDDIDVHIPLGRLVCVTGVSGSGKSTLVRGVIHENLRRLLGRDRRAKPRLNGCRDIRRWERIQRVLEVDQTPIGKTPRSCPATYVGFWDDIRRLFAETTQARMRGYTAARFSFNVRAGRCEACEGQGVQKFEMSFLPDVRVVCETCGGARFTPETLAIQYRGKSIGEVLAMSVDEAVEFFAHHPRIHRSLSLLQEVGLGYLNLGQPSPTLSGGEAQRIKLVTELARVREEGRRTLYVLDEPTIGLHMADIEKLILVLHRLVDAGATVLMIEHNLDLVSEADWIIDLGPEGGDGGGRIVAEGPPQTVSRVRRSHTGKVLQEFLTRRAR